LQIPADVMSLSFNVVGKGSSLRAALISAKRKVGSIAKELIKLGLEEENISTAGFYNGENFGGKKFFSSASDFKAEINTSIKVKDMSIVEDVLLTIADHKPDQVSNISFSLENPEKHKLEALEKAMEKAKEKASLLAKVMKVELGSPLLIKENYNQIMMRGGRSNAIMMESFASNSGGKAIFGESISITSEVQLEIEIK